MTVVIGCDARHRSAAFADEAAAVLTGAGIGVHLLPRPNPTPLLAFAIRHLSAAAGIMITASHNPAADNGYKLYLGDGAQIVPPVDAQIEAAIGGLGPLSQDPAGPLDGPLVIRHGDEVAQAYLDAIIAASPAPPAALPPAAPPAAAPQLLPRRPRPTPGASPSGAPQLETQASVNRSPPRAVSVPLRVVYTALHGVAASLALRAIGGLVSGPRSWSPPRRSPTPISRPSRSRTPRSRARSTWRWRRPNATAPTSCWPTTRMATGSPSRCPTRPGPAAGGCCGDQVGALIGSYLLERTATEPDAGQRLVVTTVVSSTLLGKIAAAAGARFAETLTGFKWIVRAGRGVPGRRFLFGYEEALGYAVGDVVRDKDGISAALALLSLAATARAAGRSLLDRWDALEAEHGVHLTAQVTLHAPSPASVIGRLRAAPPAALAGQPVTGSERPRRRGRRDPGTGPAPRRCAHLPAARSPGGHPAERHRAQAQGLPGGRQARPRRRLWLPPGPPRPGASAPCARQ